MSPVWSPMGRKTPQTKQTIDKKTTSSTFWTRDLPRNSEYKRWIGEGGGAADGGGEDLRGADEGRRGRRRRGWVRLEAPRRTERQAGAQWSRPRHRRRSRRRPHDPPSPRRSSR